MIHPTLRHVPTRLGLTGGIGSGKSTVATVLHALGAHIVDADAISRAMTQANGAAMADIARVFGPQFVAADGSLNRAIMREQVFASPDARSKLESIIHPLVAKEVDRQVDVATASCLVFDVPLLVESRHWRKQLDWVWVVDCPEETQIVRVQQRNGWERAAVKAVMSSQCERSRRLAAADAIVFNDGVSLLELQALVKNLAAEFGL